MRICYFGIFGDDYPRNSLLRRGLEDAGVDVVECRVPFELAPGHMRGESQEGLGVSRLKFELMEVWRLFRRVVGLTSRFRRLPRPIDAVVLAEFNQGLAPLAALLARSVEAPLIVDFFISLYDTAVRDRKVLRPMRPRALWRKTADAAAIRLADVVLTETLVSAEYYEELLGVDLLEKFEELPIGAPEWQFSPSEPRIRSPRDPLRILFYGSFQPLHGVEYIVHAARLLREDLRFQFFLVGTGQLYPSIRRLYDDDPTGNVEFRGWTELDRLIELIHESDVVLGIFGDSEKARRVVTNKVFQGLACGRPVITADTPGSRTILRHGENAVLVPARDPESIAAALRRLADDPELAAQIAREGAKTVQQSFTSSSLGRRLLSIIRRARDVRSRPESGSPESTKGSSTR